MIPATLFLATGERFEGYAPAWQDSDFFGEIVFNTGMVGYPEVMTDPSYCGQILVFTYPLIGNYGVPDKLYWESDRIQVAGIVVSELADFYCHRQGTQSLRQWCEEEGVPILTQVDTRRLAKRLSHHGVVAGAISRAGSIPKNFVDINQECLVERVSTTQPVLIQRGERTLIVIDCGIKSNILRHLQRFPLTIKQVPHDYDFTHEPYDAVFISNGPGDPAMCQQTIATLTKVFLTKKPVFGICLGAQIMALAIGAKTYKLPFGHRAQNHPCLHIPTGRCYLTSQNHGFAIDESTLPADWEVDFRNLNDGTVQGLRHKQLPFFSVQFHPEAAPGPVDTEWLFAEFYCLIQESST